MSPILRTIRWAPTALLLAAAPLTTGCGRAPSRESAKTAAQEAAQTVLYTVRGRVVQLPDPANPASELLVHHEPIPAFRRGDGGFGMDAMTMPFPLAPQTAIPEDLEVGDPVEMTFSVLYDRDTGQILGYAVEKLVKLPPTTRLVFEDEQRPGATPRDR